MVTPQSLRGTNIPFAKRHPSSEVLVALLEENAFGGHDEDSEAAKMETERRLAPHFSKLTATFVFEVDRRPSFSIERKRDRILGPTR